MTKTYVRKPVVVVEKPAPAVIVREEYAEPAPIAKEVIVEPVRKEMKSIFVTNFSAEFAHEVFKPLLAGGESHSLVPYLKGASLPSVDGDKSERFINLARWAFIQWVGESKV